MKYYWVRRHKSPFLILFYNGWALDEKPFLHLTSIKHDILILYDYTLLKFPPTHLFTNYQKIYQIGFSSGAFIMAYFYTKNTVLSSQSIFYVINGSTQIISPLYGINPIIFEKTLLYLSQTMDRTKFDRNMFLSEEEYHRFLQCLPNRSANNILKELLTLKKMFVQNNVALPPRTIFLISKNDKIIPPSSQKRFCQNYDFSYKEINGGHFPFFLWASWDDLMMEFQNEG